LQFPGGESGRSRAGSAKSAAFSAKLDAAAVAEMATVDPQFAAIAANWLTLPDAA
jgi:hypothetical protein